MQQNHSYSVRLLKTLHPSVLPRPAAETEPGCLAMVSHMTLSLVESHIDLVMGLFKFDLTNGFNVLIDRSEAVRFQNTQILEDYGSLQ